MATSTPNLQLHKPDPPETVNVEQDLNANYDKIDTAVGDLQNAGGWTFIDAGEATSGDTFTIDLTKGGIYPAGTFNMIRTFFRTDLSGLSYLFMRVNGDLTANLHERAWLIRRLDTGAVVEGFSNRANRWVIGKPSSIAGSTSEVIIMNTQFNSNLGMQGIANRASDTASLRQVTEFMGTLATARLLDSLEIHLQATFTFVDMRWHAEGFLVPS